MTNQKFQISEKEAIAIDDMLRKIAMKKRSQWETLSSRLDFNDIVQELWINAMDVIDKKGRVDMDLIAHASFQKLVDLIRKEIRRPSISIDESTLEWTGDRESGAAHSYESSEAEGIYSKLISPSEFSEIREMLSLFEEGSKHRKFLELAISYFTPEASTLKFEEVDFSEMKDSQDNYWTSWIAHQLGYANACSGGFQKVRNQVQAKLAQCGYARGFANALARLAKLGYQV